MNNYDKDMEAIVADSLVIVDSPVAVWNFGGGGASGDV